MKGHNYADAWDDDEFKKLYKLFEEDEEEENASDEK